MARLFTKERQAQKALFVINDVAVEDGFFDRTQALQPKSACDVQFKRCWLTS
jgi:hypothetical protein